jgi:hypothetical protein
MGQSASRFRDPLAPVDDRMEAMTRCIARSPELWF